MGHSAGTHLAGGAGAAVTSGKIPRITGNQFVGSGFQAVYIIISKTIFVCL